MRTLLLPLDGSPFAEQAIPAAMAAARRTGASIALVGVHEPPVPHFGLHGAPPLDPLFDAERRSALKHYLDAVRDRLRRDATGRTIESVVIEGAPGEALVAFAQHEQVDLVVVASHGRGGPSRLWLGSVTDRLVRSLTVPVLVVRAGTTPPDPAPGHPAFRRIVIALDGSSAAECAIERALDVGWVEGVEYYLLRIAAPMQPTLGTVASPDEVTRFIADEKAQAHEYLDRIEQRLRAQGIDVTSAVRVDGQVAGAICNYADAIGASLISMATHARGPVGRVLIGSVADKVVRGATVPVLLCHPVRHPHEHENGFAAGIGGREAGSWWNGGSGKGT